MMHKKYKYKAGYYPLNSTSLFHFFQFRNGGNNNFDKYDSKSIRIFTLLTLNFNNESLLESNDHLVYDICEDGIYNNMDKSLFYHIENFTNSACIKYFYNSTKREYIPKENPKFTWPHLEHGVAQKDNIYLNTVILKCSNNSLSNQVLGFCNSEEEINKYLKDHQTFYLYFIDNFVDPINYTNPIQAYFYTLASGVGNGISYIENNIHISPLQVIASEGLIFNSKKYIRTYSFEQNRKGELLNSKDSTILVKYYYLLQNNISIYERKYNNLLDIFSDIGGVIQMIFY